MSHRTRDLSRYAAGVWPLNGNALDVSGHGNHGTWAGTAAYHANFIKGARQCGWFDDGYITIGNPANMNIGTGAFTACAWLRQTAFAPDQFSGWLSKGGFDTGFELRFSVSGGGVANISGFIGAGAVLSGYAWVPYQWYHVAFTRDSSGTWIWYVGGVPQATGVNAASLGDADWEIGRARGAYAWDEGEIADVRIYTFAASRDEVNSIRSESLALY